MSDQTVVIGILILVLAIAAQVAIYAMQYKKVPPNAAMVVYGRRTRMGGPGYMVISGGGKFIVPVIERYELLPLDVHTWTFQWNDVVFDKAGEKGRLRLKGTVLYKVSSKPDVLKVAAEHLLGKTSEEIDEIARGTLEGHIRTIIAQSSFQDLDGSWEETGVKLGMMAMQDLMNIGIEIRSFTIHDLDRKG